MFAAAAGAAWGWRIIVVSRPTRFLLNSLTSRCASTLISSLPALARNTANLPSLPRHRTSRGPQEGFPRALKKVCVDTAVPQDHLEIPYEGNQRKRRGAAQRAESIHDAEDRPLLARSPE